MASAKDEWKLFSPELRKKLLEADPSLKEFELEDDFEALVERELEHLRSLQRRRRAREEAKARLDLEEGSEPQENIILVPSRHNSDSIPWLGIFNAAWISGLVLYFLFGG